jgi:hypothetical protein
VYYYILKYGNSIFKWAFIIFSYISEAKPGRHMDVGEYEAQNPKLGTRLGLRREKQAKKFEI